MVGKSPHPIIHIEFSAKDRVKTGEFYNELFGWPVQQFDDQNYATFDAPPGPQGGFNPISDTNPAGTVLVYVHSDDIVADLKQVEHLGGKVIVPRSEIPGTGWFGIFEDPNGNRIGLLTLVAPPP